MTHPKPRAADRFNYGINVTAVSDDHAEIWVTFVFRNGHRYCCNASSCHHGLLSDFDFERLRQCFYEAGVHVPRPMLLHMNVVCEGGALFAVDPGDRPPQYEPVAKGWAHEEAYDESEAQITF